MTNGDLAWIANYIWGIADDVLRDLYVRGKYRDVILPMTVLRRFDAVLEPTKEAVLSLKERLDRAGLVNQEEGLRIASGQAFPGSSRRSGSVKSTNKGLVSKASKTEPSRRPPILQ